MGTIRIRNSAEGLPNHLYGNQEEFLKVKLHVEHVRINKGGYDRTGRYWGIGQKLYRVYDDSGFIDKHVRAPNAKTARAMV
jgi:hypothetical protein